MALKQEILLWDEAVKYHDNGDFEKALQTFDLIPDTSRILFNCGVIHASLGEHAEAVGYYHRALARDKYLAIAYFQCGVSNFLLGEFEEALTNFNDTLLCLRGNAHIDYDQLGLKYKLHFCEAIFNRGLCYIYLQQKHLGMADLRTASTKKMSETHNVIDEAIQEEAEGFVVFSIPRGIVYRPNAAKVKNLTSKDYLGKARLISSEQERRNQSLAPNMHSRNRSETAIMMDPGKEYFVPDVGFKPTNPGLGFRTRQQSEPPRNRRDLFPPTPPPDELGRKSGSLEFRRNSGSSSNSGPSERVVTRPREHRSKSRPRDLDLSVAAFPSGNQERTAERAEKPRIGTVRAASEQPRARGDDSSARREKREDNRRSLRVDTQEQESYVLKPDIYDAVNRSLDEQRPSEQKQKQQAQPPMLQPVTYKQQRSKSKARLDTYRPVSIEEECEDTEHPDSAVSGIPPAPVSGFTDQSCFTPSSGYHNTDLLPFEIVSPGNHSSKRSESRRRHVEMTKIRVKVHGERDTRYVMIVPSVSIQDFIDQIRKKFGLLCGEASPGKTGEFKLKVRDDEGDMVTMGDQEDLDMTIQACRDALATTGEEGQMGKMEIWVQET